LQRIHRRTLHNRFQSKPRSANDCLTASRILATHCSRLIPVALYGVGLVAEFFSLLLIAAAHRPIAQVLDPSPAVPPERHLASAQFALAAVAFHGIGPVAALGARFLPVFGVNRTPLRLPAGLGGLALGSFTFNALNPM
jgi:hypothetical protein